MFFNTYPYTDFHELNLDWILKQVKALVNFFEKEYPELIERIKNDEFKIEEIEKWISDFDVFLLEEALAKYFKFAIFVGINDEGYITYYIPEDWDDVNFATTELDYHVDGVDYGHLVVVY